MYRIAVLVSGTGSNFLSLSDAVDTRVIPDAEIALLISDNKKAPAMAAGAEKGIPTFCLPRSLGAKGLSDEVERLAGEHRIDLIVLAGFLSILSGGLLTTYSDRIINIHPSLIPSFCGDGMYGLRVHQAAIDYGVKVSGCTVHFVSEETDGGPIILQKTVPVETRDAKELQKTILEKEHGAIVEAVGLFAAGRIRREGRYVEIRKK